MVRINAIGYDYLKNNYGKKNYYGGDYGESGYVNGQKTDGSWFKPSSKAPSYSTGGISSPAYDPMADLMAAYEQQRRNQIAAQRSIIDQQVAMGRENLLADKSKVAGVYQPLKNQSEVNRYNAQIATRENQANRGALDSGTGRQENLALQNNYGNNLNQIMMQEQSELDNYDREIRNLENQGQLQKAQVENDLSADLASYLNQIDVSKFQNQSRNAAQQVVKRSAENIPEEAVEEATYQPANSALLDKYIGIQGKSPINNLGVFVNVLLKQGKISAEDAQRMLNQY